MRTRGRQQFGLTFERALERDVNAQNEPGRGETTRTSAHARAAYLEPLFLVMRSTSLNKKK